MFPMPYLLLIALFAGMTLFLSLKAALSHSHLVEMCFNFHLATACWLSQVAIVPVKDRFHPVTFPLPKEASSALAYVPEHVIGNVTNFVTFLHRFKVPANIRHLSDHLCVIAMFYVDRFVLQGIRCICAKNLAILGLIVGIGCLFILIFTDLISALSPLQNIFQANSTGRWLHNLALDMYA